MRRNIWREARVGTLPGCSFAVAQRSSKNVDAVEGASQAVVLAIHMRNEATVPSVCHPQQAPSYEQLLVSVTSNEHMLVVPL